MRQFKIVYNLIRCNEKNTTLLLQYASQRCITYFMKNNRKKKPKQFEGHLLNNWPVIVKNVEVINVKD